MRSQSLIDAALEIRQRAYAPYSKFLVGAALLAESGQVHVGCNVENASYGMTICAERVAVFKAVTQHDLRFTQLALAIQHCYSPCGACLQVLSEFCDDLEIFIVDADLPERIVKTRLSELLPRRFRL